MEMSEFFSVSLLDLLKIFPMISQFLIGEVQLLLIIVPHSTDRFIFLTQLFLHFIDLPFSHLAFIIFFL